jgi:hypothetical protein
LTGMHESALDWRLALVLAQPRRSTQA